MYCTYSSYHTYTGTLTPAQTPGAAASSTSSSTVSSLTERERGSIRTKSPSKEPGTGSAIYTHVLLPVSTRTHLYNFACRKKDSAVSESSSAFRVAVAGDTLKPQREDQIEVIGEEDEDGHRCPKDTGAIPKRRQNKVCGKGIYTVCEMSFIAGAIYPGSTQ